jgi:organic hydroperoxide reductase OsmC/OhrA
MSSDGAFDICQITSIRACGNPINRRRTMQQTDQFRRPKMRFKTFTYDTYLNWLGNRAGLLHSKGKPEFRVASPPEFKGEEGVWSPEDLFVASVDICTMTTFMAFSKHKNIAIVSYNTHAEGVLESVDGKYQFTKIILRPTIVVETAEAIDAARKALEDAHKSCLVSNSIKTQVVLEPIIKAAAGDDS